MSIGNRFKEIREYLKLSQADFAKKLNVSQVGLSNYENDNREVSTEIKITLFKEYSINLNWLFTGEGTMFIENAAISKIPIYDIKASAGFGRNGDFEHPPVKGFFELDTTLLEKYKGRVRVVEVEGDSMSPTFLHGQYVVFVENLIQSDGIYIINKNGSILIKRIQFKPSENKMIIISDNPNYEKEIVDTNDFNGYILVIGKVFFKVSGC